MPCGKRERGATETCPNPSSISLPRLYLFACSHAQGTARSSPRGRRRGGGRREAEGSGGRGRDKGPRRGEDEEEEGEEGQEEANAGRHC